MSLRRSNDWSRPISYLKDEHSCTGGMNAPLRHDDLRPWTMTQNGTFGEVSAAVEPKAEAGAFSGFCNCKKKRYLFNLEYGKGLE